LQKKIVMIDHYTTSHEHLYDELLLVDLLIHLRVMKYRSEAGGTENTLQGLYISEKEIDELLAANPMYSQWVENKETGTDDYDKLCQAIGVLSESIKEKIAKSLENGGTLKLLVFAEMYGLSSFETNALMICLAPQFDSKYRKLFAYLQNDVTRKNPSVELLLNLLCGNFREKLDSRQYFDLRSGLFKNNILQFVEDPREPDKPLIAKEVKVSSRVVGFILDNRFIDEDISLISEICSLKVGFGDIVLPGDTMEKLSSFVSFFKVNLTSENFIFSFYGSYGSQKLETAAAICNELGIPLLVADLLALYHSNLYFERGIDLIFREAKIIPAAVYFKNCDFILAPTSEETYHRKYMLSEIDKNSNLCFIESESMLAIHGEFARQRVISMELPMPDYSMRKDLWERSLRTHTLAGDTDVKAIANKYSLTAGQIRDIVSTASTYALWRDSKNMIICQKDLEDACHIHSDQKLRDVAERIRPRHSWDDIVLCDDIKANLKEIVSMVNHRHIVFNEWGFDKKLSLGKGISALFYGEPGTGKTLASDIIAHELGMDLYKVDISTVVSKYVGETEKNLSGIFKAAESSNALLFFDEADSLFGKRTEVKDAHDRYANIEVSYLLQRIDEYDGVIILATNFSKNIDEAFERRLHFSINFPFPDEISRLSIWKNIFPKETPLDEAVDLGLLAKKLEISGGHIKNIALRASFYAAESGARVCMDQIIRASKREFDKIGRLLDTNELALK
jgi:SpoVK/Ycf46/Vps4 family AAA+-type ATPase